MRFQIKPGEEIDVLTQDELHAELATFARQILSGYARPPQQWRIEQSIALDNTGAGTCELYRPSPGYLLILNRLILTPAGAGFTDPVGSLTGGVDLFRDGDVVGGETFTTLPQIVVRDSESYGIPVGPGELLTAEIEGGPASVTLLFHGHGTLTPLPADLEL